MSRVPSCLVVKQTPVILLSKRKEKGKEGRRRKEEETRGEDIPGRVGIQHMLMRQCE